MAQVTSRGQAIVQAHTHGAPPVPCTVRVRDAVRASERDLRGVDILDARADIHGCASDEPVGVDDSECADLARGARRI